MTNEPFDNAAFDAMYTRTLKWTNKDMALQEALVAGKEAGMAKFKAGLLPGQSRAETPKKPAVQAESILSLLEEQETSVPEIIAGLFPSTSVNILVGDSGLGKSPLIVQMAVCVAMGLPFLGMPTERTKVLMVDYENHSLLVGMLKTISGYLKVDMAEVNKWITVLRNPSGLENIIPVAKEFGAEFITVDALRGLSPGADEKSGIAAELIARQQEYKACWLNLHHIRKDDRANKKPSLESEDTTVMKWLEECAGSRALINQTSTRIAIDRPGHDKAALLMRPFYKGKGETGRIFITRVISDDGEPVGYEIAQGVNMLSLNHKNWFQQVAGQSLQFSELWSLFSAHHEQVARFVTECQQAGLATIEGTRNSKTQPRKVCFRVSAHLPRLMTSAE